MTQLTNAQINEACEQVILAMNGYNLQLRTTFEVQYAIGCREAEAIELDRWERIDEDLLLLHPLKGNDTRQIPRSVLPERFLAWIDSPNVSRSPTSVERMRSAFLQFNPFGQLVSGSKGISTHLYRYNKFRQLQAEGYTLDDLRIYFGLTSPTVIGGYLNNPVWTTP